MHLSSWPWSWVLAVGLVVAPGVHARAENWPQFRGPTGQGISSAKGVPVEWGADKNVAWKIEVPGQGWSSPALADGKVYLTSAVPEGSGVSQIGRAHV